MAVVCDYCQGPLLGEGLTGRVRPDHSAPHYCCYGCLSLGEATEGVTSAPGTWKVDGLMLRLAISMVLAGQSMMFGLAFNMTPAEDEYTRLAVHGAVLVATLIVMALLGVPLVQTWWSELRRGRISIESLFVTTLLGAFVASLQAFILGGGRAVYFDVVSILLVVYTLGKLIGARSRSAALASTRAWAAQLATCELLDDRGRTRSVPVTEVVPGDVVRVLAGATIPVDGVVRAGTGFVTESAVNGEPFPVVRRPGDRVLAGAVSNDASFEILAQAKGNERQIDKLLSAVEAARLQPTSLQGQADRLAAWFVPVVLGVAMATFIGWTGTHGWEVGLFNAMSVLLVACPCALGLATPIVLWHALGKLAEHGVVVHGGDTIERLAQVDQVLFDKTGTLTDEQFALVDVVTVGDPAERTRILGWLAAVERHSTHPVARPFAQLLAADVGVEDVRVVAGQGISATIAADGRRHAVTVGSEPVSDAAQKRYSDQRLAFTIDGTVAAIATVAERLRASTPEALSALRNQGLAVEVLTGDSAERAAAVGLMAVQAALLPDDKRRIVAERVAAGGKPLVVGDGINDASALAAGHVGLALAGGTDLANAAAAVTLYPNDLRLLPWTIALCRQAVRTVRRNLFVAFGYNLLGMSLAAAGVLHPVVAAFLMVGSSLYVAWASLRLGVTPEECGVGSEERGEGSKEREVKSDENSFSVASQKRSSLATIAFIHAFAFMLQGPIFAHLASLDVLPTTFAFGLIGGLLGWLWLRWESITHEIDMNFGMLTVGNLGMLLGWWADVGFAPVTSGSCPCSVGGWHGLIAHPWMWLGMLLGGNIGMIWLMRRPCPVGGYFRVSMFGGGNVGMLVGMLLGGRLASSWAFASVSWAVGVSLVGMTLGMIVGMLAGYGLCLHLLPLLAKLMAGEVVQSERL